MGDERIVAHAPARGRRATFALAALMTFALPSLAVCGQAGGGGAAGVAPATVAAKTTGVGRVEYAQFRSESLGREVACAVSLPPSYDADPKRRYPVVIFLHGLFNSERDWEQRGIEAKLAALRASGAVGDFIVAAPNGANSFYLNGKDGTRYEDAIVKDFIPWVDKTYRTEGTAKARVIEGISMGGFGALTIAFKHPELFAGVAAHSAAVFDELPGPPASEADQRGKFRYEIASKIFGAPPDRQFFEANSPLYLGRANAAKLKNLKIYFDVGASDRYGFDAGNKKLDAALTAAGVAHEFEVAPGDHGWSFLTDRSSKAFAWVWATLGGRTS